MVGMQDVIARAGRFWGLYKRAGHRVMINPSGDLIVRPTFIEAAAQLMRPWSESDCPAPLPAQTTLCTHWPCSNHLSPLICQALLKCFGFHHHL